jgi:predicted DsbA family dithiol-disulfide isomerase
MNKTVQITILSDLVCPWCNVGIRRLKLAAEQLQITLDYTWEPFILSRQIPSSGVRVYDYLSRNYGTDRMLAMNEALRNAGKEVGIKFSFHEDKWLFPTVRGHALVEYAKSKGKANELVALLFSLYMEEDKSLYDIDNLVAAAKVVGLGKRKYLFD